MAKLSSRELAFGALLILLSLKLDSVSSKARCASGEYRDKFLNLCQKCTDCCPPRPANEFCKKKCNLREVCDLQPADQTPTEPPRGESFTAAYTLNHIVCVVTVVLLVLFVVIGIVCFLRTFRSRSQRDMESSQQMLSTEQQGDRMPKELEKL